MFNKNEDEEVLEKTHPRFLGFDLSLNHAGIVLLDKNCDFLECYYCASTKGSAKKGGPCRAVHWVKPKGLYRELWDMKRLILWGNFLKYILTNADPAYVAIEGYAYSAVSNSSYQYAELAGLLKIMLWNKNIPFRIHDPLSVKIFSTGKGNSKAPMLVEKLPEEIKKIFLKYDNGKNKQTSEDLAAAYWIARLMWVEYMLRQGWIYLSDLTESERKVFLRVTKTYPENILAREWLKP